MSEFDSPYWAPNVVPEVVARVHRDVARLPADTRADLLAALLEEARKDFQHCRHALYPPVLARLIDAAARFIRPLPTECHEAS